MPYLIKKETPGLWRNLHAEKTCDPFLPSFQGLRSPRRWGAALAKSFWNVDNPLFGGMIAGAFKSSEI